MAFTRKMLKAMGIEDEKIEQIMDAHVEVTEALKADRDRYKADAEKLPNVQKELDDLKADGGDWKSKYETERKAFADFKSEQTAKETKAPTCTEKGSEQRDCGNCDYTETREVAAIGHTPTDWIIDREPAPGVEGSKHKECTVCGEVLESEVIEALPEVTEQLQKIAKPGDVVMTVGAGDIYRAGEAMFR